MDQFDRAEELEQMDRDHCLAAARNKPGLVACGGCHNCGERVAPGRLFCDVDCRDDYEKRVRQR